AATQKRRMADPPVLKTVNITVPGQRKTSSQRRQDCYLFREVLWAGQSPELSSVLPTARVGNARFEQLGQVVRVLPPLADRRPLNVQRNVPNARSTRIRTTTSTIRTTFLIAVTPS